MRTLPPLATRDRVIGAVLIVALGIAQASALAVAAFATRDAFAALHAGTPLELQTIVELAISAVIAALCLFFTRRQAEALGQSYATSMRRVLYEAIAQLPKSRHEERRLGGLSLRFVGDLSAARLWFGRGLPNVLTAMVVLPGVGLILFALDPVFATVGLVPLGVSLIGAALLARHLERRHSRLRRRRANIAISMIERIAVAPELDVMGRTKKELRDLDARGADLKSEAVARRGRTAGLQAMLQGGVALSGLAILWLASASETPPATVAASLSVLALIALPLQDLAAAWDQFCAWRVARSKAERLLREPALRRRTKSLNSPATVSLRGFIGGEQVAVTAQAGTVIHLDNSHASTIARVIAGLDPTDLELTFNGRDDRPRVAYIGDDYVCLRGSLRRSVTLQARRRPKDAEIVEVLKAFGLNDLLLHPKGLDQRMAENGKNLASRQTLRLDLAQAVLSQASVVVISSIRWRLDPDRASLLDLLQLQRPCTVIVAETSDCSHSGRKLETT